MEAIFKIVQKLENIRQVPQFIFIGGIRHASTLLVRKELQRFINSCYAKSSRNEL